MNGGENTEKVNKLVFALILSIMLLFSAGCVFAAENETVSDVVSTQVELEEVTHEHDIIQVQSSQSDEAKLEANDNVINVHVYDSYNETGKTWSEDGFKLPGATVNVYSNPDYTNLLFSAKSNANGIATISNLAASKYYLEVTYSSYNPIKLAEIDFTKNSGTVDINDVMFVPDILLLVDYASHNEKVDVLMNMSRRVAYISTTNFDESRAWLAEYANYIHIDMFAENSAYNRFSAAYLKELLKYSPANINYKVAYTFGTYTEEILNTTGIHIIGASPSNNYYDTIENTYIGSYFQAEDIKDSDVLLKNMKNYFDYVCYLIEPSKYSNPTLTDEGTPLMSPECGFYHPDVGMYTLVPDASLIKEWITTNPGYTKTSDGSLNWMCEEYLYWVEHALNPQELYSRFENDLKSRLNPDKKLIAIATYYCGGDLVDSLIRSYAESGRVAFNVFKTSTAPSMSSILLSTVTNSSKVGISTITSLYSWSLSYANGSAEEDLSAMDLAVLKGVYDISEYSHNSELGPQLEWTYAVTFPSFEGVYGPVILSYVDGEGKSHVIQTGVDKMVKLSCGWADLKDLGNSDKTIAIVLYNYPPGKAEIGASYLNVTQSTYDLLVMLYEEGYDTGGDIRQIMTPRELEELIFKMGNKGSWAYGLLREYVEDNYDSLVAHNQLISTRDYRNLIKDIPQELIKNMTDYWGSGLGPSMVYNGTDEQYMVVPGMWFGKIFVTFQPSRGWEEIKTVENYHDLTLPPTQYYVSFYKWLDQTAKVNAIVNMGTHGTLEWLPGTNLGAASGDWTFELTLNPTIYPYIVSNPGEAMVARDRIAALLITHMTPAMVTSGLYGNYTLLNNYITYYKDQMNLNVTSNAEEYKAKIIALAPALGFREFTGGETFQHWLDDLHLYLEAMEDDFITYGLHTLGKILSGEELVEEVITITTSQTRIYDYIMEFLYPEFKGKSFYDDIQGNLGYLVQANEIKQFLKKYVTELVNGSSIDELAFKYSIPENSALYNSTCYAAQVIVNIQNNNEWNAILTALEGGYVPAGLFADPSYGDSIPTGYDGYASDPSRMPSKAAYESAVKIVDLLLAEYYEQHGSWPELTSLILWGTEISRTEGIGVAEFLYFLGCKPVWADNGKVIDVELLPLDELTVKLSNGSVVSRPRIDVFASIVTSNKDWISWMVSATKHAAFAPGENESNNFVIKHYNENPSLDRLFGLPGNVLEGTGMANLVPNTADWDINTLNDFAMDVYLSRVSYSWTIDENGNLVISNQKDTFVYLLNKTDLITQNFDSTWRLFDSDDYYDWFGGLYNAASVLKERSGQSRPDTSFVDIRSKNNYIARSYEEEIEFEIRTMLLNPKYYMPLVTGGGTGMNSYAARFQNMYGGLTVANDKLGKELGNQLADELLGMGQYIDGASTSAGYQTSLAWMVYMANQGTWSADASTVQKLVDRYMEQVLQYGVACCHHTCKNLAWNAEIIQMSSLTPAQKAKFADILAQATNTDPLYQMPEEDGTSGTNNGVNGGSSNSGNDGSNAQQLVNGTSNDKSSSQDGGKTAVGADASEGGSAKSASASELEASSDSSSADAGDSGAKAYELSEQSAAKSASATESSMPIFVIIAIIVLIAIFLVGYARDDDEDYDDY